jgi:hypothetical protein
LPESQLGGDCSAWPHSCVSESSSTFSDVARDDRA